MTSLLVKPLNGDDSFKIMFSDALVARRGSDLLLQQQRVAVYDNSTRQFHVQLICGNFRITGYPPVAVEFTVSEQAAFHVQHPACRKVFLLATE